MADTGSFITIRDLEHTYPQDRGTPIAALRGIDLTIERAEFVALVGANGSGKSTLAYHLNGLLLPTRGQVWVDGMLTSDPRHTWAIRQRVGMVFQNPDSQLVASTVEEDVAFGPENYGLPTPDIRRRVDQALALVGLEAYRTHPPQMLSGGQKQLAAIAGALATHGTRERACIVFDEPTSMLDPASRHQVLSTIWQLNQQERLTVILITQSMEEAAAAQRVLVMHAGRIVMDDSPQQVFGQPEQIRTLGLSLPPVAEMTSLLRNLGLVLPSGLLTVNALARAIDAQSAGWKPSVC